MSWREIGALLLLSDKTASVWVIEALPALADCRRGHAWNANDGRRGAWPTW